jgi:hypothetical protein
MQGRWQTSLTHYFGDGSSFSDRRTSLKRRLALTQAPWLSAITTAPRPQCLVRLITAIGYGRERSPAARRSRRRTRQFRSCSSPDGASPGPGRHPLKLRIHTARGRRDAVGRCSSPTGRVAGSQIRMFACFSQWRGLYVHSGPLAEARDDASAEILDWAVGPHRYKRDQLTSLAAIPQLQPPCATGRSWRTTHVRPKRPPSPHGRCRRQAAATVGRLRGSFRRTAIVLAEDDRFDRGDGPEPACA